MTKDEWKKVVRKIYKLVEEDFIPVSFDGRIVSTVDKETDTIWLKGFGTYELCYAVIANNSVASVKLKFRKSIPVF